MLNKAAELRNICRQRLEDDHKIQRTETMMGKGFSSTHLLNLSLNYFYKYCATLLLFVAFVAKLALIVVDDVT